MAEEPKEFQIPVSWVGAEELPVLLANQFVGRVHEDTFFLTVGQMVPPALIGTPEEQAEQLEVLAYIPVKPLIRLTLSRADVQQLVST